MSDFDKTAESAAIDDVVTALYELDGAIREARNLTYCGACGKGFPNANLDHKCLRDQFAMAALPFFLTQLAARVQGEEKRNMLDPAQQAYVTADAMLEARKKESKDGQ